jgi:uncharacterized protein YciI
MTLYAVWATDGEGQLAERERVRPTHRARLRDPGEHRVKVVLAGPTLDGDGGMNGTLLVVEAGVYRSFEIRPFVCGLGPLAPTA